MEELTQECFIDVVQDGADIVSWIRGVDGSLSKEVTPIQDYMYGYIPCNEGRATHYSLSKIPLKRIDFSSFREKRTYEQNHRDIYESDIAPVYKYILDNYSHVDQGCPFNYAFYDIEVDFNLNDGLGYPRPRNPHGAINSISLFDSKDQKYKMFVIHSGELELEDDRFPVEVFQFQDEFNLLDKFARELKHVDVIAGWNSQDFDLPYIMARSIKLFGKSRALHMFCRDGFDAIHKVRENDYNEEVDNWRLMGRHHLDLLPIFKKFIPKELDSHSLDSVCEAVLGMNKIQYVDDGDLGELYRNNPKKFFEYSLHDSRLLLLLNEKLSLIELTMMFTRDSCVLPSDVTGSIKPIEMALVKFCREKGNLVLPNKVDSERQKFPGAIVYDTISGRYGWSYTQDLTALYPSVMIMLGLSPETYIMQCADGENDFIRIRERREDIITVRLIDEHETWELKAYELDDIIQSEGYCISANGSIFNGELGILAEFVLNGQNQRQEARGKSGEFFEEGDTRLGIIYDLMQKVYKIRNNSVYGAISNNFFRMFDIELAKSITLTGQWISKFQAYKANELLREVSN